MFCNFSAISALRSVRSSDFQPRHVRGGFAQLAVNFVQQVLRAQAAGVDHLARVLNDLVADAQARGDGQRVGTPGRP
jgi:hypothetical protein